MVKEPAQNTQTKGNSFVILNNKDVIQNIEKQTGKSVVSNINSTYTLTSKIQKHLAVLRKQQKFDTRTHFKLYPSNPVPPRVYKVVKVLSSCYDTTYSK